MTNPIIPTKNAAAPIPLTDLELYELLSLAYPEKFGGEETEELFDEVMDFAEDFHGASALRNLLGRVVLLTVPTPTITGQWVHCIGKVTGHLGEELRMTAVVRRAVVEVPNG